jgi:uncharacterized protein YlxW (UPF0749 family)
MKKTFKIKIKSFLSMILYKRVEIFSQKKPTSQIMLFAIALIFGIVLALQIKTIEKNQEVIEAAKTDYNYYANLLASEKEYTKTKTEQLEELKIRKNELLEKSLLESGDTALLDELRKINKIAGFTDVSGPGIIVTLNDQLVNDPAYPANTSSIHDLDIRQVVDVMRSCGAVAISINGERVVTTSEITCNGPTVQVNKKKFSIPYVISAIGDVVLMKSILESDNYLINRILSNIQFEIEIKEEISILAFSDYDKIEQYIDSFEEVTTS